MQKHRAAASIIDLAIASGHKSLTRQRRRAWQRLAPDPSLARQASLAETMIKGPEQLSPFHSADLAIHNLSEVGAAIFCRLLSSARTKTIARLAVWQNRVPNLHRSAKANNGNTSTSIITILRKMVAFSPVAQPGRVVGKVLI